MAKKIYDIKPPKVARKVVKKEPKISASKVLVNIGAKKTVSRYKKEPRSIWWSVSTCILIIVLAIGTYLFFKLPKADIVLWPTVQTLSFQQTITADKSVNSVDLTKSVIPAQYFQADKTNAQDFPATGNASNEGYASGMITVFNKCDPASPLTLSKGAHFLSDSGKSFSYLQKIVIPAATKKGTKVTPGSVQLKVQADDSGTSFNIAPAAFSIPKLSGTIYFSCIYATSSDAMTGGYTGKVKKVTDDDIQGAKDVLTKKTTADAVAALKTKISSDYILLDNAVLSNTTNASTPTKSGTVADSFNYQVAVTSSALVFKKSDLEQFAKNYIISQMPEGKTLLDNSFKIDYSASTVDVSGGKATLNLDFSSGAYPNIDKNSVTLSLLGQNADQIKATINNSLGDGVSNVKVSFWPFWVVTAPSSQKAVNIELKFQ